MENRKYYGDILEIEKTFYHSVLPVSGRHEGQREMDIDDLIVITEKDSSPLKHKARG